MGMFEIVKLAMEYSNDMDYWNYNNITENKCMEMKSSLYKQHWYNMWDNGIDRCNEN